MTVTGVNAYPCENANIAWVNWFDGADELQAGVFNIRALEYVHVVEY